MAYNVLQIDHVILFYDASNPHYRTIRAYDLRTSWYISNVFCTVLATYWINSWV